MKNLGIIFTIVCVLFGLLFGAYIIVFKLYFSSDRLSNQSQRIVKMIFQRDSKLSDISLSPFGKFKMQDFSISARKGFSSGVLMSAENISSEIAVLNLLKRELLFTNLNIEGLKINLNYENKRKFNYKDFFANVKYLFYSKASRQGIIKKAEIENIKISSSEVNLKLDQGLIKFTDINLSSGGLYEGEDFSGKVNFKFYFKDIESSAEFDFNYEKENEVINISDFQCEDFSLFAEGKIFLSESGSIDISYTAKINKEKYLNLLGKLLNTSISSPDFLDTMEEIIISYPAETQKLSQASN